MLCAYFQAGQCRSCELLDQSYAATLQNKQALIADMFPSTRIHAITPTSGAAGSRIRARLAVFGTIDSPQFGFLNQQREVAAVAECPLHHPALNRFVGRLPDLIASCRLTPWALADDRGELKFVVLTCAPESQQLMVQLVLRSRESIDRIRRMWHNRGAADFPEVAVLSVNLQPVRSSLLNGPIEIPVSEQRRLPIAYGTTTVLYGPQSFIQSNHEVASRLYQTAARVIRQADITGLLDLYCGTGAFSLMAAAPQHQILGVDVAADSIDAARESARILGLSQARYECCPTGQFSLPFTTSGREPIGFAPDAVICNPPRRGLDAETCRFLVQTGAELLLYSSCNPVTLRRDADLLAESWRIEQLHPFDMFPFTRHVETLAVLRLRRP